MKDGLINLGAHRAKRDGGHAWTPVEVVRSFLAEIENGLQVDRLVISYQGPPNEDNDRVIGFRQATPDSTTSLGILTETADLILHPEDVDHG